MRRPWVAAAGAALIIVALSSGAAARSRPAGAPDWDGDATWHDFNGDGLGDLAIGSPGGAVSGHPDAGSVTVLYGSSTGLVAAGSQVWSQDSPGVVDSAEKDDSFGEAVAAGDFDDDGFGDLAIGVPGEDKGGFKNRGAVAVLYGGPNGLSAAGDQLLLFHATSACFGGSQVGWRYGAGLAVADIGSFGEYFKADPDGHADLAVGFGSSDGCGGASPDSGGYDFLWGTDAGVAPASSGTIRNCVPDHPSDTECGLVLAYADLNADHFPDLVMGLPRYDIDDAGDPATGIDIDPSDTFGLLAISYNNGSPDRMWVKASLRYAVTRFGSAIAVGDVNADGDSDLVVGAPGAVDKGNDNAGAIVLIQGDPSASKTLDRSKETVIVQSAFGGLLGTPAPGDFLGAALAIGNVGRGAPSDLVMGIPGEKVGDASAAGKVIVAYGQVSNGKTSVNLSSSEVWSQDTAGVLETAESDDRFGFTVRVADLGRGGAGELIVGVPFESRPGLDTTGTVQVIYGTSTGLTATNDQQWHRDRAGVAGASVQEEHFGLSLP